MEWSKSTLSPAELERRRREYIEAAMDMSRRAVQPVSVTVYEKPEMALPPEEPPETREMPETREIPEALEAPAPEEIPEEKPEKKTFGVFDMQQLTEAVRNGEMDGEKLREAAEILEEMSGKTREMQILAENTGEKDRKEKPDGAGSLNKAVQRHNNGSGCPRSAGQGKGAGKSGGNGRKQSPRSGAGG